MGRGARSTSQHAAPMRGALRHTNQPVCEDGLTALRQGRFLHAAPAGRAQQITVRGLDPDGGGQRRFNGWPPYPNAVYVWTTGQRARVWAERMASPDRQETAVIAPALTGRTVDERDQDLWELRGVTSDRLLPDSEMFGDTVMRRLSDDFFESKPFGTTAGEPEDDEQEDDPIWQAQSAAADQILSDPALAAQLGAHIAPHLDEHGMLDFTRLGHATNGALAALTAEQRQRIVEIYARHDLALMVQGPVPSQALSPVQRLSQATA